MKYKVEKSQLDASLDREEKKIFKTMTEGRNRKDVHYQAEMTARLNSFSREREAEKKRNDLQVRRDEMLAWKEAQKKIKEEE